MLHLQQRKRLLADALFGGSSGAGLTPAEVEDLFGPLDD
jgi:hypothetical protein